MSQFLCNFVIKKVRRLYLKQHRDGLVLFVIEFRQKLNDRNKYFISQRVHRFDRMHSVGDRVFRRELL